MRTLSIPLPPLPEQHRIVARIESLFQEVKTARQNLEKVPPIIKRFRQSVLASAFRGELVPQNPGDEPANVLLERIKAERKRKLGKKYKEPEAVDAEGLPSGWEWTKFEQIAVRVTKGSSPNWQGFDYTEHGIPFIRSQNVGWGITDLSNVAYLPAEFNQIERKSVLHEGDVLLNIVGASIGRAAIAPSCVEGSNVNQAVAVIRLHAHEVSNQFVLLYLLTPHAQQRIHSKKVDVARANFSLEEIREMPLPLPPLPEQHRIVARIEQLFALADQAEQALENASKRADRMEQAILAKAFRGELVGRETGEEGAVGRIRKGERNQT